MTNPNDHTRDGAHDDAHSDSHTGSPDDARLTAYVLGELDAAEAAEVEALMASSPDIAREVEEIRAVTGLLEQGLAAEAAPELTDAQRVVVLSGGTASGPEAVRRTGSTGGARPRGLLLRNLMPLAAAATVLLASVWMLVQDRGEATGPVPGDGPASSPVARLDKDMTGAARPAGDPSALRAAGYVGGGDGGEAGHVARREGEVSLEDRARRFGKLGYLDIEAADDGQASAARSQDIPSASAGEPVVKLQQLGYTGGNTGIDDSDEPELDAELYDRFGALAYPKPGEGLAFEPPSDGSALPTESAKPTLPAPPASAPTPTVAVVGIGGSAGGEMKAHGGKAAADRTGTHSRQAKNPIEGLESLTGRGRKTTAGLDPAALDALRQLGYVDADARHDGWGTQGRYTASGQEGYAALTDNPFKLPAGEDALSTFSVDVDTGSYSNVRRFLNQGRLPPADAVRIEELINYFEYADAPPKSEEMPFAVHVETAAAPWAREHRLVRIGLKGWAPPPSERPAANLVFLLDVSGSMNSPDKLPLLKSSMRLMVNALDERDRVAIVTYAGSSGLVLESTTCEKKSEIMAALDRLSAGGSTNGGAGIELAYKVASEHFIEGGLNRVLLATDGDFNVGVTQKDQLEALITGKAKDGVFLTVLGFGTGNLKDSTVEMLADKGNGHYAYIDSLDEGRRVLVDQLGATLQVIAKDVKIQVEFNPGHVGAWRLIGYANRQLAARDFNDDTKDAGEIGAGHGVVALYEIAPPGTAVIPGVDPLKYQKVADEPASELVDSPELMTIKLRWKRPDSDTSAKIELPVVDAETALGEPSTELRFAAALAAFGMQLRDSPYRGETSWDLIASLAASGRGSDPQGYRAEFVRLVDTARAIAGQ